MLLVGLMMAFTTCKSKEATTNTVETDAKSEALVALLENNAYKIDIHTVYPFNSAATTRVINSILTSTTGNSASRINVQGNGNFIQVQDDTVEGYLPYFGEQRQGGGRYGASDNGILFDNAPEEYKVFRDKKSGMPMITFTTHNKNHRAESYDVNIAVSTNKRVVVNISSTHRSSIRYIGSLGFTE